MVATSSRRCGVGSIQILGYSLETDGNAAAYKTGVFASTVKLGN